jgi:hypothetical protein
MVNPQKTLEREAMLKRIRELDAEIAQHERNLREGEAQLPIEEQLRLKLRRFIEASIPDLAGKIDTSGGISNRQFLCAFNGALLLYTRLLLNHCFS